MLVKTYKSKIGLGLVLFQGILLGGLSVFMIIQHIWVALFIILAVAGFSVHLFISTCYMIRDHNLIIKSGFVYRRDINIYKIKKISETNNVLSSPAMSLDRIMIYFNNKDIVMVSPKEKEDFIQQLQVINPKIAVVLNQPTKQDQ